MPEPQSAAEFLELLERSQVLESGRLREAKAALEALGMPQTAAEVAQRLREAGLITKFHEGQLLAGRSRGFRLGKYRILDLIGTGGMGRVYLAEHAIMRRQVAIKVLPKEKSLEGSALGRFQREARAVAALDHPNIVRAYDIDNEGDLHFMVMEYVPGLSLQQYVQQYGPTPWRHAAEFIRQAADALEHAAEAGMVHRDIKPGNLLLDPNGQIKVLDLGLAVLFEDAADGAGLTIAHNENVLGTADYLAPEQAVDSHNVDARADIYGLGGTLYFLLTGKPPFPTGTIAQKLLAHQQREPQPVEELAPDVPPGLAQILRYMMRKRPAERYPTSRAVADALAPFALPLPQPFSQPPPPPGALAKPPSSRPGAAAPTLLARTPAPMPIPAPAAVPAPAAAPAPGGELDFLSGPPPKRDPAPSGSASGGKRPAPKPPTVKAPEAKSGALRAPAKSALSGETKLWIGVGTAAALALGGVVYMLQPSKPKPEPKPEIVQAAPKEGTGKKKPEPPKGPDRSKDVQVGAALNWKGPRTVLEGLQAARPGQTVWLLPKAGPWDAEGLALGVGELAGADGATLAGTEPFTAMTSSAAERPAVSFRGKRGTLRDLSFENCANLVLAIAAPEGERFECERVAFRNAGGNVAVRMLPGPGTVAFRECLFRPSPKFAGAELAAGKDEAVAGTVVFERCVFVGGVNGIGVGGPVRKLVLKECRFFDCAQGAVAWGGQAGPKEVEIVGCTFHRCGAALQASAAFPADAKVAFEDCWVSAPRSAPLLRNPMAAPSGLAVKRSGLAPGATVKDDHGLKGEAMGLSAGPGKFVSEDPESPDFLKPAPDPGHAKLSPQRGYLGAVKP